MNIEHHTSQYCIYKNLKKSNNKQKTWATLCWRCKYIWRQGRRNKIEKGKVTDTSWGQYNFCFKKCQNQLTILLYFYSCMWNKSVRINGLRRRVRRTCVCSWENCCPVRRVFRHRCHNWPAGIRLGWSRSFCPAAALKREKNLSLLWFKMNKWVKLQFWSKLMDRSTTIQACTTY